MRTLGQLKEYRCDLGNTKDVAICRQLDALIAGDETQREELERLLDDIDTDCED